MTSLKRISRKTDETHDKRRLYHKRVFSFIMGLEPVGLLASRVKTKYFLKFGQTLIESSKIYFSKTDEAAILHLVNVLDSITWREPPFPDGIISKMHCQPSASLIYFVHGDTTGYHRTGSKEFREVVKKIHFLRKDLFKRLEDPVGESRKFVEMRINSDIDKLRKSFERLMPKRSSDEDSYKAFVRRSLQEFPCLHVIKS